MVTVELDHDAVKGYKVNFAGSEPVTAYGGVVVLERLCKRLGFWRSLGDALGRRRGGYDWATVAKSVIVGLLCGGRGTYAAEGLRDDGSALRALGLDGGMPEEATVWRALEGLGEREEALGEVHCQWARQALERSVRNDLLVDGFVPVFADGTLLEGSPRREGTKFVKDKGWGVLWSAVFVGPLLAGQRLCAEGEGEQTALRDVLRRVCEQVLEPLSLRERALLLMDSLHGDGPTLDAVEALGLRYAVGANKLEQTRRALMEQPEGVWENTGEDKERGFCESGVCACWLECEGWGKKRLLIGRRWRREGELYFDYSGVLTNLGEADVAPLTRRGLSFTRAVWRLYERKMGCENYFKDALEDINLHHPPCREHKRNAGFYALGALAALLGRAVDLIGGRSPERGRQTRRDGSPRQRPKPRRLSLGRLRQLILIAPARITRRARRVTATVLGLSDQRQRLFEHYWTRVQRC